LETFPPASVVAATPELAAVARRDPTDLKRAGTVEKAHGRIETRRIAVRTKLPVRLDESWSGLTAICRIERIRETKDRCSREVIYAITSLPPAKLVPEALLQLSRDHWRIENSLFHVRDVTFMEDASRVRTGEAPKVMAELRNATLTIIRQDGGKPRPAREAYAARPRAAIRRLLTS
jgi:predicted transposase YbfD/YdcC